MQEGKLASAPYASYFESAGAYAESGKILKVGRSLEVSLRLPTLTAFFSRGRNILFQILGGGIHRGGAWPTFFETGDAYADSAPRLCTPLVTQSNINA